MSKAVIRLVLAAALGLTIAGCASVPLTGQGACRAAGNLPLTDNKTAYAQPDKALALWTRCVDSGPQTAILKGLALKMRSHVRGQLKQYDEAIKDLEASQRLMPPRESWDFINLASLYRETGQPERALGLLRKMQDSRLGLSGMAPYYHLGRTLSELKQWPEATEAFTEGMKYQPTYAWAYLYRALAYDAQGKRELARTDLQRGKELLGTEVKPADRARLLPSLRQPPFDSLLTRYGYDSENFVAR
ncbi:tetratricopeptide repeat protein [Variovorax sp. CAN2819]|uniref:tetratricopeptide repeat protein n=1 Tax=Variovorax sp. CAN15 TaxID=3046727 RepID=UPI0026490247|nr:tetratricopeptide repeat protein [Variovorax sp. CAN15]MDN6885744.1 tetratricopeptide repeat protein [Variovorax sp. CAN15]